ncbi:uncharacterized protein [Misgurnus anguillicaudatus]|uniref:uncharacterized protein n=1 Tax=Misgurnus anguillicaudatus TaxID=75329 RepID=UPI003CCF3C91
MNQLPYIGGCLPLFIMAIVFDITGLILLLFGIFGDARKRGVFYGDFLIHSGALILFASLGFWLMWYIGNIRVAEESLERRSSAAHSVKNLARKLTERLSKTQQQNDSGGKPAGKASTLRNVTFGKSSYFPGQKDPDTDTISCDELSKDTTEEFMCYQNKAYEDEESSVNKSDDSSKDEKESKSDESQEKKPGDTDFTCYQNEGYEGTESAAAKDTDQKPEDQPENCDTLL